MLLNHKAKVVLACLDYAKTSKNNWSQRKMSLTWELKYSMPGMENHIYEEAEEAAPNRNAWISLSILFSSQGMLNCNFKSTDPFWLCQFLSLPRVLSLMASAICLTARLKGQQILMPWVGDCYLELQKSLIRFQIKFTLLAAKFSLQTLSLSSTRGINQVR